MKVGELDGDLRVQREEDLLPGSEIGLGGSGVGGGERGVGRLRLEVAVGRVEALHHRDELVLAELDLNDSLGLEDTSARLLVGVPVERGWSVSCLES